MGVGAPGRRTGVADLPLHGGRAPRWLYERMVRLADAMLAVMLEEFSPAELLRRFADPFWFQALGALLGFDWHSSGLTTVTLGAVKQALASHPDWPLHLAGGKGKAALATPREIDQWGERRGLGESVARLKATSRLVAKVDNAAVQDGYHLYHHVVLFDDRGRWAVIQQGAPRGNGLRARRYHWLGEAVRDPVEEPHSGVVGDRARGAVLDLTARANRAVRAATVDLVAAGRPDVVVGTWERLRQGGAAGLALPGEHAIPHTRRLDALLYRLYQRPPTDFVGLLETEGVGPATLRALVMVAEVVYGVPASRRDPIRYAYAHGGKDGHPFPVSREDYDHSIAALYRVLDRTALDYQDKRQAFRRLAGVAAAGGGLQPVAAAEADTEGGGQHASG